MATIRGVGVLANNDPKKSVSIPAQSAKPNSIDAAFTKDGKLNQIAEYGADRKLVRLVDFDHPHKDMLPHAHVYVNGVKIDDVLTDKDRDRNDRLSKWRRNTTRRL